MQAQPYQGRGRNQPERSAVYVNRIFPKAANSAKQVGPVEGMSKQHRRLRSAVKSRCAKGFNWGTGLGASAHNNPAYPMFDQPHATINPAKCPKRTVPGQACQAGGVCAD